MVINGNSNTVAVVNNEVDADSFRRDTGWFELTDEQYNNLFKKDEETTKTKKVIKKTEE
jgi:hypothetical protein